MTPPTRERGERDLASRSDKGLNGRDADHHGVAYHVVHLVALEDGLRERDGEVGLRRCLAGLADANANAMLPRRLDNRLELPATSVEDAHGITHREAQVLASDVRLRLRGARPGRRDYLPPGRRIARGSPLDGARGARSSGRRARPRL